MARDTAHAATIAPQHFAPFRRGVVLARRHPALVREGALEPVAEREAALRREGALGPNP